VHHRAGWLHHTLVIKHALLSAHRWPCSSIFAEKLQKGWQRRQRRRTQDNIEEPNAILHVYRVVAMLAARLDKPSLKEVLDSAEVSSVIPNCIVKLTPEKSSASPPASSGKGNAAGWADHPQPNVTTAEGNERGGGSQAQPPWGLDRVDSRTGLDDVYHYGSATGHGTVAYVLDTGVRVSHADFGGRALPGWSARCPTGVEAACSDGWAYQGVVGEGCSGHGTHCASTLAGRSHGVAKESLVVTVQVLDCSGFGSDATVIAGVDWAVQQASRQGEPPSVLSMSVGGSHSSAVNVAIASAVRAGVSVVAAAGNENADACAYSPASAPEALTVGAVQMGDAASSFSNHGPCVDVFAPGSGVTAAWNEDDESVQTLSGTSSTPPAVKHPPSVSRWCCCGGHTLLLIPSVCTRINPIKSACCE
jgi:hypothetical protein